MADIFMLPPKRQVFTILLVFLEGSISFCKCYFLFFIFYFCDLFLALFIAPSVYI